MYAEADNVSALTYITGRDAASDSMYCPATGCAAVDHRHWRLAHRVPDRASMFDEVLSLPQLAGYLAFVLGVVGFLQRDDRRFKRIMVVQALAYAIHFFLLGQVSAVASSVISVVRTALSLYTRSLIVALLIIAINLAIGPWLVTRWTDWLPLIATCIGTYALFVLDGIPMRLALLSATAMWLANNILVGSIGGTALEVIVATANIITIIRLRQAQRAATP